MDNVVKFPNGRPERASPVPDEYLDELIANGFLQHDQRHNWRAIKKATADAFYAWPNDGWGRRLPIN